MAGESLLTGITYKGSPVFVYNVGHDITGSWVDFAYWYIWMSGNYPSMYAKSRDNLFGRDSFTMTLYYKISDSSEWTAHGNVICPDGGENSIGCTTLPYARWGVKLDATLAGDGVANIKLAKLTTCTAGANQSIERGRKIYKYTTVGSIAYGSSVNGAFPSRMGLGNTSHDKIYASDLLIVS